MNLELWKQRTLKQGLFNHKRTPTAAFVTGETLHETFKMAAERRDCDQLCGVRPRPHFLLPRRALPVMLDHFRRGHAPKDVPNQPLAVCLTATGSHLKRARGVLPSGATRFIAMATARRRVSESHDGADGTGFPLNYDRGSFTPMMLADMRPGLLDHWGGGRGLTRVGLGLIN